MTRQEFDKNWIAKATGQKYEDYVAETESWNNQSYVLQTEKMLTVLIH